MAKRLLKALMLAFGAIFGLKGEGAAHWSETPDHVVVVEHQMVDPAGGE